MEEGKFGVTCSEFKRDCSMFTERFSGRKSQGARVSNANGTLLQIMRARDNEHDFDSMRASRLQED